MCIAYDAIYSSSVIDVSVTGSLTTQANLRTRKSEAM